MNRTHLFAIGSLPLFLSSGIALSQDHCVTPGTSGVTHVVDEFASGGSSSIAITGDFAIAVAADLRSQQNVTTYERVDGTWTARETMIVTGPSHIIAAQRVDLDADGQTAVAVYRRSPGTGLAESFIRTFVHDGTRWQHGPDLPQLPGTTEFPATARARMAGRDLIIAGPTLEHAHVYKLIQGAWVRTQELAGGGVTGLGRGAVSSTNRLLIYDTQNDTDYQIWSRPTATALWSHYETGVLGGILHIRGAAIDDSTVVLARNSVVDILEYDVAVGRGLEMAAALPVQDLGGSSNPLRVRNVAVESGSMIGFIEGSSTLAESFGLARPSTLSPQWNWDQRLDITPTTDRGAPGFALDDATLGVIERGPNSSVAYFADFVPSGLDCDGNCVADAEQIAAAPGQVDRNSNGRLDICEPAGTSYCLPAPINSTGASGALEVIGSPTGNSPDLLTAATRLPVGSVAMLVSGDQMDLRVNVGGSAGTLCLGGARFARFADQVRMVGPAGAAQVPLELTHLPSGTGTSFWALPVGSTHYFQMWYRDHGTSNLTNAVAVTRLE